MEGAEGAGVAGWGAGAWRGEATTGQLGNGRRLQLMWKYDIDSRRRNICDASKCLGVHGDSVVAEPRVKDRGMGCRGVAG